MAGQAETDAAILAAYQQALSQLRQQVVAAVSALWGSLKAWREPDINAFVAHAVPLVLGGQRQTAVLTSAFLARQRSAALGGPVRPVAVPPSKVTGAAVRNGTPPETVYGRAGVQVWRDLAAGKPLDVAVAAGERRAVQAAATDLQLTKARTAQAVLAKDDKVVGYRRVLTGDHSCALCVVASTQRYHRKELLPVHPGCVAGGTAVTLPPSRGRVACEFAAVDRPLAMTRRRYTGELVIIRTAGGDDVAVTPNHPVLTADGWLPGQRVGPGDDLIRYSGGHRTVGGGPNERQSPAAVEDVWRAASVAGFVRVPLAAEDFHGDGSDGEVEVVYPDSDFAPVGGLSFAEPLRELSFVSGHGGGFLLDRLGAQAALLPGGLASFAGGVGAGGLSETLIGGHLCGAHQAGIGATATLNFGVPQNSGDDRSADRVLLAERVFADACEVLLDDLGVGQFDLGFLAPPKFDPSGVEFLGDGRGTYARLGRALVDRLSGDIEFDRAVEVRRVDYSGHVYNLQTSEGWYTANSHIVSNCDCSVEALYSERGQVIDEETLIAAHDAIKKTFGISDAAARNPDYRKILVVHQHGELGPTLGVAGHLFSGPKGKRSGLDLSNVPRLN